MDTQSTSALFRGTGLGLRMIFRVVYSFTRLILYGLSGARPQILRGVRIFHGCSLAAHSSRRIPCFAALITMRIRLLTVRITLGMPIFRIRSITALTILWDAPTVKRRASRVPSSMVGWVLPILRIAVLPILVPRCTVRAVTSALRIIGNRLFLRTLSIAGRQYSTNLFIGKMWISVSLCMQQRVFILRYGSLSGVCVCADSRCGGM